MPTLEALRAGPALGLMSSEDVLLTIAELSQLKLLDYPPALIMGAEVLSRLNSGLAGLHRLGVRKACPRALRVLLPNLIKLRSFFLEFDDTDDPEPDENVPDLAVDLLHPLSHCALLQNIRRAHDSYFMTANTITHALATLGSGCRLLASLWLGQECVQSKVKGGNALMIYQCRWKPWRNTRYQHDQ